MSATLLIGGVRSGKSGWAVRYANRFERKTFIATASAIDEEMRERIERHQEERGEGWNTIEAGLSIVPAIHSAASDSDIIVVDCLTLWMSLLLEQSENDNELFARFVDPLLDAIERVDCELCFITNEVGSGIVPVEAAARRYRDLLGAVNQRVAAACDRVLLFVAGIPTAIKGTNSESF